MSDKEVAPAVSRKHPGTRTTKEQLFMATTSVQQERMRTILREAVNRYRNELMDDEERLLLLDRIKRIRRQLKLEA